jgi:hypothetical protein
MTLAQKVYVDDTIETERSGMFACDNFMLRDDVGGSA